MLSLVKHLDALSDERGRVCAVERYSVLDTQPEPGFEKITNIVKTIFEVPIVAVSLIDHERQWFKSIQGFDASETPRSASICNHTIKSRECMVISDVSADPRFAENPLVLGPPFVRAYAGAPLETPEAYNVGTLCVVDTRPREFNRKEIEILRSFAGLVVEELELRQAAARDCQTNLLGRHAFAQAVESVSRQAIQSAATASLVMFDLDRFKSINDTWGHPAGDAVIKAVAGTCSDEKRPEDILGRIGGEEFGMIMPNLSGEAAVAAAERMRRVVENAVAPDWPDIRFTASFGVADLDPGTPSANIWVASADAALYRAKAGGRNRAAT
ncbi:MAG: sensor domain-containing diguanylate cyclase [Pseudomonadota bacterium]